MRRFALAVILAAFGVAGCQCKKEEPKAPEAPAQPVPPPPPPVPAPAPIPAVPLGLLPAIDHTDNPTTPEKVDLGYKLFFDKRMSHDKSMSCVDCHYLNKALTTGSPVDTKVGGAKNTRNAPTLVNLDYSNNYYYWDGRIISLEMVSNAAWKGQLGAAPAEIAKRLGEFPVYTELFKRAFNEPPNANNIPKALAAFLRSVKSGNSPYDKFQAGDKAALNESATRGLAVFNKAKCVECHVPPFFTDMQFHNVGVGWDPKEKKYADIGRQDATKQPKDGGAFKTPTLRNIALTGPYMHDGSIATLEEAIELMASGGVKNPNLDPKLKPQKLSADDKADLKAFLEALTGDLTLTQPPVLP